VGASFGHPGRQGQDRLRAIQRLDLALLVHAKHQRLQRRVQVQPDDVAHLVDEQRVRGELISFGAMGLKAERAPDTADRALRELELASERARAPIRGIAWNFVERGGNQPLDLSITNCAWRSRAWSIEATLNEAKPPFTDALTSLRRVRVRGVLRACQNDPRTQRT
jgi:hypothetical protein